MSFKWRDYHMPLFLAHFKKYECLWNHQLASYKDRSERENAIRLMKNSLNIDGVSEHDIKLKIKTIRTKYSSEATKIRQSTKSGSTRVYKPKVFWFDQADDFLKGNCNPRETPPNLVIIKNEPSQAANEDNIDVAFNELSENSSENIDTEAEREFKVETNTHTDDIAQSQEILLQEPDRKQLSTQTLNRRKRRSDIPIDRAIRDSRTINEEKDEDEFDLFCRSLAVQLKKMPLQKALICQEKLQSVMVRERLSSMDSPTVTPSSSHIYYEESPRDYVYIPSPPSHS